MRKNRELSVSKVMQIVELTEEGKFRPEIAKAVNVSPSTVYKYQIKFNLV